MRKEKLFRKLQRLLIYIGPFNTACLFEGALGHVTVRKQQQVSVFALIGFFFTSDVTCLNLNICGSSFPFRTLNF